MENFVIIAILIIIVGLAAGYIIKAKKSGQKCIGCPHCNSCSKNGHSCNCETENKQ